MSLDEKPGAKELFGVIKKSPALTITVIAGGALVVYLLAKRSGSGAPQAQNIDSTGLAAATSPGGYYSPPVIVQPSFYIPPVITADTSSGGTVASSSPGATSTAAATIPSTDPRNTPGESNNFYVYTTRPGDTLASLTSKFKWNAPQQKNGGVGFTYNYRNNASIFKAIGADVNAPNAPLTPGVNINA